MKKNGKECVWVFNGPYAIFASEVMIGEEAANWRLLPPRYRLSRGHWSGERGCHGQGRQWKQQRWAGQIILCLSSCYFFFFLKVGIWLFFLPLSSFFITLLKPQEPEEAIWPFSSLIVALFIFKYSGEEFKNMFFFPYLHPYYRKWSHKFRGCEVTVAPVF